MFWSKLNKISVYDKKLGEIDDQLSLYQECAETLDIEEAIESEFIIIIILNNVFTGSSTPIELTTATAILWGRLN